jgi:bile acid:Na+ symporter, BASS family
MVALMYGLGMNNNGTGLVLASLTLAAYPRVMVPIIFYNLVQHVVAGSIHILLDRSRMVQSTRAQRSTTAKA